VVGVTGVRPSRPDDSTSRKPPTNETRRIHITILAELRMVWSTRQDSLEQRENRRGERKKLDGDEG